MNTPPLPDFTPEFGLLLASALYPLNATQIEHLQFICNPVIDWPAFNALVERHGLAPIVYRNLSQHLKQNVDRGTFNILKEGAKHYQERSFKILAELRQIAEWFTAAGIRLCALKGPLLSQQLFGDATLRTSSDLDLLIPYKAIQKAEQILLENGYQRSKPAIPLSPRQWQAYQQEWYHVNFVQSQRKVYIELHWNIASPNLIPIEFSQQLLSRSEPITLSNAFIHSLTDEDLPVYLLIHGAKHNWGRLKWLVDFATWIRTASPQDWESASARMDKVGLQRPLLQGVLLAHWLFELPIPEFLSKQIESKPVALKLANASLGALLTAQPQGATPGQFKHPKQIYYQMSLKKGWRYRWSVFAKLWSIPHDWQDVPLPDFLFPLYGLLRPFLWLRRYRIRSQNNQIEKR